MDQFLLQNAGYYQQLLNRFQPEPERASAVAMTGNPDMVVATRVRPLMEDEKEEGWPRGVFPRMGKPGLLDIHEMKRPVRGKPTLRSSSYRADRSYDTDSNTEEIYRDLVEPLVPWVWGGGIGTLFAYGQTGSGKTFTVSLTEELVVETLLSGKLEGKRTISMSIIELAGNTAYDLLNSRKQISVLEDSFGVTQLAGALEHRVTSANEAMGYIESAASFRRTASTEKNNASSRSHAICRIRVQIDDLSDAEDGVLYLVDLAGSEAARDRANHATDRLRESREINVSLSTLKDCIRGKAESDALMGTGSKRPYIPFRQSALTKVLKHVFDPAGMRTCKTVVLACVNPSLADIMASKNTLRYVKMLRVLVPTKTSTQYDAGVPMTWSNKMLRAWIDIQSGSPAVNSMILAPEETGTQLLRMPAPEFESRCLKTEGVSIEQAKAFRSKLWQLHIDSQRSKATKSQSAAESTGPDTILGHLQLMERKSSRDPDPNAQSIPFKERIRPGMVVQWTAPHDFPVGTHQRMNLVVVLCPTEAVPGNVKDLTGKTVNPPEAGHKSAEAKGKSYLCAMVMPGLVPESYEMSLWRHAVVHEDMMDAEVILEYEGGTRLYYISL